MGSLKNRGNGRNFERHQIRQGLIAAAKATVVVAPTPCECPSCKAKREA
jgi:hypothetical protein